MANVLGKQNRLYVDTDGVIFTGRGRIIGLQVVGGTAVTRIKLYDGSDATFPFIFDSGNVAIDAGDPFPVDIKFKTGLFADITTTGGYAWVYLG